MTGTPRQRLYRLLRGYPLPVPGTFARRTRALELAETSVRVFYAVALYFVASNSLLTKFLDATSSVPLWCVRWVKFVGVGPAGAFILGVATLSAAGCALWPSCRWLRIVFAVGVVELGALSSSFGKINHGFHVLAIAAVLLCFLPRGEPEFVRKSATRSQTYLLSIWSLYASFLLAYSISGMWKVGVGLMQAAAGQPNAFSPSALAYHVAVRLLETNESTPLAELLLRHPAAGWPASLTTLYLETFSFVVAFRPRLYRAWALGLIAFHLGSGLVLGIDFRHHILLLGVLGLASPFAPTNVSLREILADLPLFGDAWRVWRGKAARVA